jgi:hypothetical protein
MYNKQSLRHPYFWTFVYYNVGYIDMSNCKVVGYVWPIIILWQPAEHLKTHLMWLKD